MLPPQHTRRSFISLAAAPLLAGSTSYVALAGVRFMRIQNGDAARRYLVIHGDERTAREVLLGHMVNRPGQAYLVESITRTVRPHLLEIDPNRMFSDVGAARSFERLNATAVRRTIDGEVKWLAARRQKLFKALLPPAGGLIIVLHNNARGYSVNDEIPISNQTHIPRPSAPHEFFLATAKPDFDLIAKGPYNAVLQSEAEGPDDGSLSRLCAARGIRYVNLECSLGNIAVQAEMLRWMDSLLP